MTATPAVVEVVEDGIITVVDLEQPVQVVEVDVPGVQGPTGPQGLPGTIVSVGPTPPLNPQLNDLWVDTS